MLLDFLGVSQLLRCWLNLEEVLRFRVEATVALLLDVQRILDLSSVMLRENGLAEALTRISFFL